MRAVLPILLLSLVAGCGAAPKTATTPPPTPVAHDTFKTCTWGEVRGDTLSIWSFTCGPDSGNAHLVADNTLPGFALVGRGATPDEMSYAPVIRTFAKPEAAPIASVLADVRKASPGPDSDGCVFTPALDPTDEHSTRQLFELAPAGAAKAKWDDNVKTGEDATPPCGPMGVSFAGSRVFEVMKDDPTRVVYIDYGSEIQIFDTATLKALK